MPQHSYTVTPSISEDPVTGEVTYNVMQAEVTSSAPVEATQRHNVQHQDENWIEDPETGNTTYHNTIDDTDITNLIDGFGGHDELAAALAWAGETLSQEDIDDYDRCMSAGDLNEIADYMSALKQMYESRSMDVEEPDEYMTAVRELAGGREGYEQLRSFITDNFDNDFIDQYNQLIDGRDFEQVSEVIGRIIELANNYND